LHAVALAKVFQKAGREWWEVIIPIYNTYVMFKVAGRPGWWLLLLFVPLVNIVVLIMVMFDLAKAFGHGAGFALGLIFLTPIFLMILGFGSSQYQLGSTASAAMPTATATPTSMPSEPAPMTDSMNQPQA